MPIGAFGGQNNRRSVHYSWAMPPHHTKDKGDLGVAKAHADVVGQGFVVLFPATQHAPFDLAASADGAF